MPNTGYNDESCAEVLCFSHLRWNFVYQWPQHLLNRAGVPPGLIEQERLASLLIVDLGLNWRELTNGRDR